MHEEVVEQVTFGEHLVPIKANPPKHEVQTVDVPSAQVKHGGLHF